MAPKSPYKTKDSDGSEQSYRQTVITSQNKNPLSQNLWRRLTKLGHPADCNHKKEQFRQKTGTTKSKKRKRSYKPSTKGNDCLFKINCQYPDHHWYIKAKTQTRSNVRSAEFRFEEHHEERVVTNILWAFTLCFSNRESNHVTTLQKS